MSMNPATVDLVGWRNAPFPPDEFAFTDDETGDPYDFTGMSAALDVRVTPGTGTALISLDTTTSPSADGIRFTDAAAGKLMIQIGQAAMQSAYDTAAAALGAKAGATLTLFYDLIITHGDGVAEALIEGSFKIQPGVTL